MSRLVPLAKVKVILKKKKNRKNFIFSHNLGYNFDIFKISMFEYMYITMGYMVNC